MQKAVVVLGSIIGLIAVGCEAQSFRVGQRTRVQYGTVRNVEEVPLQSDAGAGALIGGTIGLAASGGSSSPVRNAIAGAALGGVATAAAQGGRVGMSYTVETTDGSTVRVVSDQREIHPGDCVAIEQVRETTNIRREPPAYCRKDYAPAVESVHQAAAAAASRCEAAKEELVRAATSEAPDTAKQKIDLLCNG
jgi:outer membrane lipoprotein SlyB